MLSRFFSSSIPTTKEVFHYLDKGAVIPKLPAIIRTTTGTNASNRLRSSGVIPGIVYGDDGKGNKEEILVGVPQNELIRYLNKYKVSLECTVFDLMVEDKTIRVFPRQLQCDPLTELPISLNFLRYDQVHGTNIEIPVETYNRDKNVELKLGNLLNTPLKYVSVKAFGNQIPSTIQCDLSKLVFGKPMKVRDLDIDSKSYQVNPAMLDVIVASIPKKKKVT